MSRAPLLTEDVQIRICKALRAGATLADAAAFGGVTLQTMTDWRLRGHRYEDQIDDPSQPLDPWAETFRQFVHATEAARAEARVRANLTIASAMTAGDWRAAAWYLERSDPANWGRQTHVELTGAQGGPVEVLDVTDRERAIAQRLRSRVLELTAPAKPDDGEGEFLVYPEW